MTESSEFLLTLFSGFAQAESESISKNVIWGIQKSREAGKVPFQYTKLLGYRRGADGEPEVDPEEAEVVKRIYRRYLDGCSLAQIKAELETDGVPTNVCVSYIKNLISLGIVQKETPYGEKASRKSLYSIEDNMFRFWHRFVLENNSLIARGAADLVYQRIEPQLDHYMGKVFEEICKQYLWTLLLDGRSPVEFASLDRWWGNDPIEKTQAEIDILGEQDKATALFGECKWTNEKVDLGVLETLVHRSHLFQHSKVYCFLFSKSGFTKGCMKRATELGNVTLVEYADILKYYEV